MEVIRAFVSAMGVGLLVSCAATSESDRRALGDTRGCVITANAVQNNDAESGDAVLGRCLNERSEARPNLLGQILGQVVGGLLFSDAKDERDR